MDFEESLSCEIPVAEAASFFLKLKKADAYAPPDETGELEGQFGAPVEQVLKLLTEMVENELKTMYAYKAYAHSLRDLSHFSIAEEFEEHADNELEHADFLLRRMSVLGGPIELNDIPAPPATTDPNIIVETMIRMEQEGISKWRALQQILGDNPMRFKVEEFLARELEHLDELWQLCPYKGGVQPTAMMTRGSEPGGPREQPLVPDAAPAQPDTGVPGGAPKMANAMADVPPLSPTGKGQNPVQPPGNVLPPAAQGQHQKLALALRPLPPGQREALTQAFGKMEKGLQARGPGVLRQIAPDLKSLADRAKSVPKMKAAAAFKLALEQTGLSSSPAAVEEAPPVAGFAAAEEQAAAAQEQNELAYYRQKMQEAFTQLQAQKAEAEQTAQRVGELEQQVASTQAQQGQYQQMVSNATQDAVAARDEVLREQQASAAMRMAYQQLRGQLLNVASQEPPSTEMLAEQAAMTAAPTAGPATPAEGPAGQAATPAPAPGSPAPQGDQTPSAPASGQDPAMAQAKPASEAGQKEASILDQVKQRAPYALGGAALGGAVEKAYAHKSSDPLRAKVQQLEGQPERGFGASMDLAQAKARLALADAVGEHPKAALLSGALLGGLEGAIGGPGIADHVRSGVKNLKSLHTLGG